MSIQMQHTYYRIYIDVFHTIHTDRMMSSFCRRPVIIGFHTKEFHPFISQSSLQILGALGVVECALLWLDLNVKEQNGLGSNSGDNYENDSKFHVISTLQNFYSEIALWASKNRRIL